MSKKKIVVLTVIIIAVGVAAVVANSMQKKTLKPVDRYSQKQEKEKENVAESVTNESVNTNEAHTDSSEKPGGEDVQPGGKITEPAQEYSDEKNVFEYDDYRFEVLACDIIKDTDMVDQTKYPLKNFAAGEAFDPMYLSDVIDFEALGEESPEYRDMLEHLEDYSYEEKVEITERNRGLIEKYSYKVHKETWYVFLKLNIVNLRHYDESVDEELRVRHFTYNSYEVLAVSPETEFLGYGCYRDFPEEMKSPESDSECIFKENQSMECVVGFEAQISGDDIRFYFGHVDTDLMSQGISMTKSKYLIDLEKLPEI